MSYFGFAAGTFILWAFFSPGEFGEWLGRVQASVEVGRRKEAVKRLWRAKP